MFGLAVIVCFITGMGLWIWITAVAMKYGWKAGGKLSGNNLKIKIFCCFLGFMITMGGIIVSWVVEYFQLKYEVAELCAANGKITVYVSPEEWKQRVQERALSKQVIDSTTEKSNEFKEEYFDFEGRKYHLRSEEDNGLQHFIFHQSMENLSLVIDIYVDKVNKQVLFKEFSAGVGAPSMERSLTGWLKIWLNRIPSCTRADWSNEDWGFSSLYKRS